jgi:hypothetical protein
MIDEERVVAGIEEVVTAIRALVEIVERASSAELRKLDELIAAQSRPPDLGLVESNVNWIKSDVSQIRDHLLD